MRVFAPRRCLGRRVWATYGGPYLWSGIPLEGEWVDIPDYFKQITRNNPINDVIHAKLVDPTGFLYTKWDQVVSYRGEVLPYPQVHDYEYSETSGLTRYLSIAPYHLEHYTVEIDPAKVKPGGHTRKDVYERHEHGLQVELSAGAPRSDWIVRPSVEIRLRCAYDREYLARDTDYLELVLELRHNGTTTKTNPYNNVLPYCSVNGRIVWDSPYVPELWNLASSLTERFAEPDHRTREAIRHDIVDATESWLNSINPEQLISRIRRFGVRKTGWTVVQCTDEPIVDHYLSRAFILGEKEIIAEKLDPLMFNGLSINTYWRNYLTEHALLAACESLPRLNDNSIQNIVEIVSFIKGVVVDHKINMPKSLADAWLQYRYEYCTGKADIDDAIKFVHRRMDLGTLDRLVVGRGTSHHTFSDGTNVTCRCQVEVTPKDVSLLKRIWRALDTYGLTPDFYVIWDAIPYSFMVDWFLPISDILGVWDANSMYFSGEFYTFTGLSYSFKYTRDLEIDDVGNTIKVQCYTRWAGSVPSSLNSFYWLEPPSASEKTTGKRILDAAAIFIGR